MADLTPVQGQIMDWTLLDDTGAVPTLLTGEITEGSHAVSSAISFTLHIDMCHADSSAAGDPAGFTVYISSGTGDEEWHALSSSQATGGTASLSALAAASGSGESPANRVELAATANFSTPGKSYFILDNTIVNSEIVVNKDTAANDYMETMKDMAQAHDASDSILDIVDQWNVRLPQGIEAAIVQFWNRDADATYACRVRYSTGTDIV